MKLVIGLGNPGAEYAASRHNAGYRVARRLADDLGIAIDEERFSGRFGTGWLPMPGGDPEPIGILLPTTFMNRSGDAARLAIEQLPVADPPRDLVVILDDVDLPFGRIRLRTSGGAGGHKGLGHVLGALEPLGFIAIPRLRFGVGRPGERMDTVDWVLGPFTEAEEVAMPQQLARGSRAVVMGLTEGIVPAMNLHNRDADPRDSDSDPDEAEPEFPAQPGRGGKVGV
ncbi:MAG: aminoacyl-tRNA hydrolase [Myxococcales bacterium]|nr:aminoacyl-tRNA hydrolase [Myxococcales bacterium]